MIYELPSNNLYGNAPIPLNFPDNWDVTISNIKGYKKPELSEEAIKSKISNAIGTKSIKEGAKGKKKAVIIFDDITRPTPIEAMAKIVISELMDAGIEKKDIWFIVALGAHRAMYWDEFVRKLGQDIVDEFEIYNHNPFFNNIFLGNTSNRIPVEVNADIMAADYKVGIGSIVPHPNFGFSGGAKILLPGVCSLRTITKNHSFISELNESNIGKKSTIIKSDAEEAAIMAGLDFKIDAVLNGKGEVCEIFAGNVNEEMELAMEFASDHFLCDFVPDCDIVISNSYMKPSEACVAYTPETIDSLKEGGDYVLSANSPQGPTVHYLWDRWGHTSPGGSLWSGVYEKHPKVNNLICLGYANIRGMQDVWFVSEESGAILCKNWEKALNILDDGTDKKVVVYPYASCQLIKK